MEKPMTQQWEGRETALRAWDYFELFLVPVAMLMMMLY